MKMQQIEQEFQISLRNERHQHNVDLDILTQEKESLRGRLVSVVDELIDSHQKQQDELISAHQEEISVLKKKIALLEKDYDEKLLLLKAENKKNQNDWKLQVSSLEKTVKELNIYLSECEVKLSSLEEKIAVVEQEKQRIIQENSNIQQKLKDELNNAVLQHTKTVKEMENQIKDLRTQKESISEGIEVLQLQLNDCESEKDKMSKELDELNAYFENEKSSKAQLEDRISLIQNQLSDEKSLNELINKSLDDCKQRLKSMQSENLELKRQLEEANQEINVTQNANGKQQSQNTELKTAMRDLEKSRQEAKREAQNLKRKIKSLESALNIKEHEITELNILHGRQEEKEDELKKEIVLLKQKILESNASNDAVIKEMVNSKQKLSGMEHKIKLQQEQHHSVLQECLSNEQNLSEHRLNLERSLLDATKEIQDLRACLNFEEGKVLALESRIAKLDGTKRDVENKLYSIYTFLRSALNLGTDSGFLSSSSNLKLSPWPSKRETPEKSNDTTRSSIQESPHHLNLSKSSSPVHFTVSDRDIELVKTTLMDLIQKYHSVEQERNDLKNSLAKMQTEEGGFRSEHSKCISKIYQLKRDLEDKKNVEKELAMKIASIHHYEEVIQTLEREKRRLTEKIGTMEFSLSAMKKEKENLLDKIDEMKKTEHKHEEEMRAMNTAKEVAESQAMKYYKTYQALERDVSLLQETIADKVVELKSLKQSLKTAEKKLDASESRNKSLLLQIDHLNLVIEKHMDNEKDLKQKVNSLSNSLVQNSSSQQNLYEEVEKIGKERLKYQKEISSLHKSLAEMKNSAEEYKLKNRILTEELADLKRNLELGEMAGQEYLQQITKLKNTLVNIMELEKEATQQVSKLQEEKLNLDRRIIELSATLRESQEISREKDDMCRKFEKEKHTLQKSLEKFEREKHRTSGLTAKSLLEKSSLGRSFTKMETENYTLQQKVQNLQAQLAELEERHSQRVKEILLGQSVESKTENERLRISLKQTEQLMETRERKHRQRILGLEEQIAVLKHNLEHEKNRWQQYHQRSLSASTNIKYLHSVLSKSLQNVSDDPQKLLPEAERLDMTTEMELSASPGISVSTPSKLSRSTSYIQMTSTPKAKKRLDLSSKS